VASTPETLHDKTPANVPSTDIITRPSAYSCTLPSWKSFTPIIILLDPFVFELEQLHKNICSNSDNSQAGLQFTAQQRFMMVNENDRNIITSSLEVSWRQM